MNNPKLRDTLPWIYSFSACGLVTVWDVGFMSDQYSLTYVLKSLTNSILITSTIMADEFNNCIKLQKNNHYIIILDYIPHQLFEWWPDRENYPICESNTCTYISIFSF